MWRRASTVACLVVGLFIGSSAHAATMAVLRASAFGLPDMDGDGLPNAWEVGIFGTDPAKQDTDGDTHDDWTEGIGGFHPVGKGVRTPKDFDKDGLNDMLELRFGSDPMDADTDKDGHRDGEEVGAGFSPTSTSRFPLEKIVRIRLKAQRMDQVLGGVTMATHPVSTGKASTPTPVGTFKILSKNKRAWSRMAGLWMPWWMQFTKQGAGLHELPEWPGGHKEGAAHLGTPVSHGCVRLGIGPAKALFDWAPVGTPVVIVRE